MPKKAQQIFLMAVAAVLLFAGLYFGAKFDFGTSIFVAISASVISYFTLIKKRPDSI